jgi:hypothetical protein
MTEIVKVYKYQQSVPFGLKKIVLEDEKRAAKELGGPVDRTHRFLNDRTEIEITWRRKPE